MIRLGALKEAVIPQMMLDTQTADEYLEKLMKMELQNAMLFYHRKKLMIKGIQHYSDLGEVDIDPEPFKPSLKERLAAALKKGPLSRALASMSKDQKLQAEKNEF